MVKKKILSAMAAAFVAVQLLGDDCNHSTGIHHHRCGQHR